MSIRKAFVAAPLLLAWSSALPICTAEGAYGIRFGEKVGLFAKRAHDPNVISGPYLTTYEAKATKPDIRFSSYLVRVENDAKVIYVITALKKLFTADSLMTSGEEYRARVYPALAELAAEISAEQGATLQKQSGDSYALFTTDMGLKLVAATDGLDVYAELACINLRLSREAEQSAGKKVLECLGDGSVYKPECHQGPAR